MPGGLFALTMALYGGILVVVVVAARRRDFATVMNGIVSFAVAILPQIVEFVGSSVLAGNVSLGVELSLWLGIAGLLHSVGMLGPYDSVSWWDTLTHAVTATLLAALAYASFLVAVSAGMLSIPVEGVAVLTVAVTFAGGVFWELIELCAREIGERFDVEPVLVHYGWRDTALDLVVDGLGAMLVVLLDVRTFVPVTEQYPSMTTTALVVSIAIVVAGSGVLSFLLAR